MIFDWYVEITTDGLNVFEFDSMANKTFVKDKSHPTVIEMPMGNDSANLKSCNMKNWDDFGVNHQFVHF